MTADRPQESCRAPAKQMLLQHVRKYLLERAQVQEGLLQTSSMSWLSSVVLWGLSGAQACLAGCVRVEFGLQLRNKLRKLETPLLRGSSALPCGEQTVAAQHASSRRLPHRGTQRATQHGWWGAHVADQPLPVPGLQLSVPGWAPRLRAQALWHAGSHLHACTASAPAHQQCTATDSATLHRGARSMLAEASCLLCARIVGEKVCHRAMRRVRSTAQALWSGQWPIGGLCAWRVLGGRRAICEDQQAHWQTKQPGCDSTLLYACLASATAPAASGMQPYAS